MCMYYTQLQGVIIWLRESRVGGVHSRLVGVFAIPRDVHSFVVLWGCVYVFVCVWNGSVIALCLWVRFVDFTVAPAVDHSFRFIDNLCIWADSGWRAWLGLKPLRYKCNMCAKWSVFQICLPIVSRCNWVYTLVIRTIQTVPVNWNIKTYFMYVWLSDKLFNSNITKYILVKRIFEFAQRKV